MGRGFCSTSLLLLVMASAWANSAVGQSRSFETEVLAELNEMRRDPYAYSSSVAATRSRFDGKILKGRNKNEIDIATSEGVAAVNEAVAALRAAPAVGALAPSPLLARIASDLVVEQGRSGGLGHRSNGRLPADRSIARGGGRFVSEVITYGHFDPASVIEQFVVGDGVPDRGHRKTLLADDYRYAGAACGSHPVHRTMCVIILSQTVDGKAPQASSAH